MKTRYFGNKTRMQIAENLLLAYAGTNNPIHFIIPAKHIAIIQTQFNTFTIYRWHYDIIAYKVITCDKIGSEHDVLKILEFTKTVYITDDHKEIDEYFRKRNLSKEWLIARI